MPAIDKIIASAVEGVKKSGTIEAGTLMATVTAVGTNGTLTVERGPDQYPSVRILSGYLEPTVGDRVEILKTNGGWVCIGALRTSSNPRVQSGLNTTPAPGTGGGWSTVHVTFVRAFASVPRVTATPNYTDSSATTEIHPAVNNVTTTGFDLRCNRTTNSSTVLNWIATDL